MLLAFSTLVVAVVSQVPDILWQKTYGIWSSIYMRVWGKWALRLVSSFLTRENEKILVEFAEIQKTEIRVNPKLKN